MAPSTAYRAESAQILSNVPRWERRVERTPEERRSEAFRKAVKAVDDALVETIKYMKRLDEGAQEDVIENDRISGLWRNAGALVEPFDKRFANACYIKGIGWIDHQQWERAREGGIQVGIGAMLSGRMNLVPPGSGIPQWFPIAGVCFAAITVIFLMYLVVAGRPITPEGRIVFNVLVALCVSASGAFLGGTAAANGKIQFLDQSPVHISAAGGIGIFVVVLIIMKFAI